MVAFRQFSLSQVVSLQLQTKQFQFGVLKEMQPYLLTYGRHHTAMLIKEMFEKEIDRDIQGVIIVGQSEAENVAQPKDKTVKSKQ